MTETPCTRYVEDSDPPQPMQPCKCPVCGGFLKWDDPTDMPICNKCGVSLIAYPDVDEETGAILEWGKICPIGKPKPKPARTEDLRIKRQCKAGAKAWRAWRAWL